MDGDTAFERLIAAEEKLFEEYRKIEELKSDILKKKKTLTAEKEKEKNKRDSLIKAMDALAEKKLFVDRLKSSSCDARKMYGDMIPGDTTHQDVILAYQNHFKSAHHSMPKKRGTRRDEEKFEVWEECAQTVQRSYDKNRDMLVKIMLEKLRNMLSKEHEELDEATYDLQRAFEMFVQELKQEKFQMMVEK
uniref:Uncharacterized protein n=1 Tax=Amphimedon queenslandica TaxID=400682 RepID=A0A1X7UVP5_AMPQE